MDDFLNVVVAQEARRDAALRPVVAVLAVHVAVAAADGFGRRFLGDRAEHVEIVGGVRLLVVGEFRIRFDGGGRGDGRFPRDQGRYRGDGPGFHGDFGGPGVGGRRFVGMIAGGGRGDVRGSVEAVMTGGMARRILGGHDQPGQIAVGP